MSISNWYYHISAEGSEWGNEASGILETYLLKLQQTYPVAPVASLSKCSSLACLCVKWSRAIGSWVEVTSPARDASSSDSISMIFVSLIEHAEEALLQQLYAHKLLCPGEMPLVQNPRLQNKPPAAFNAEKFPPVHFPPANKGQTTEEVLQHQTVINIERINQSIPVLHFFQLECWKS